MTETPGQRVYAIRLALGDGWKKAMPMAAFAELLSQSAGVPFDSAKVSRIESGERRMSIDDVDVIAALDPRKRGRSWLAWGAPEGPQVDGIPVAPVDMFPEAESSRTIAAKKAAAKKGKRA